MITDCTGTLEKARKILLAPVVPSIAAALAEPLDYQVTFDRYGWSLQHEDDPAGQSLIITQEEARVVVDAILTAREPLFGKTKSE